MGTIIYIDMYGQLLELMYNTEQAILKVYSRVRKNLKKYYKVMKIAKSIRKMASVKT